MAETFACRLRVRYNECDPQGIVFNANYFTYFDVAVTEFFRVALGGYTKLFEHGCDLVVREASARFSASAGFDDELELRVAPSHLGRSSMVTEIVAVRGAEELVHGRMVHVFVEREGLAAREMPEAVRAALRRYLIEPAVADGSVTRGP